MIRRKLIFSCLLGMAFIGCSKPDSSTSDSANSDKLFVAATTTMVTDLVRTIGGEHVEVTGLMGPGVDPHLYQPKASDARTLRNAEVIFFNGLHLEGRMEEHLEKVKEDGKLVFSMAEGIAEDKLIASDEEGKRWDPHIWGDAAIWKQCVAVVVEGLTKARPDQKAAFESAAASYTSELDTLDSWAKARSNEVDPAKRIIITSHDAFNYLGTAYGFQVVGVQGISTVSKAGLADIAKTTDFIKEKNIKAIFVESSVSKSAIERISTDSGATIGGELFSDAMGKPGDMESAGGETYDVGTYIGMLKHNINTVVDALK